MINSVLSPSNLRLAWEEVASKKGAPGADQVTIRGWRRNWEERLVNLARAVRTNTYQPQRVRCFWVDKNGGGRRKLAVLTVNDRVLQRAVLRVTAPRFERIFLCCSYGYRKRIGLQHAVRAILAERSAGQRWVVDADIDACFDSLDHSLLRAYFSQVIPDPVITGLVQQWIEMDKAHAEARRGVLQGAVISPLLCNIYLHRLDQGLVNRAYHPVRYADDFCVFCASEQQAHAALEDIERILSGIRLRLEPNKTRIACFETGFDFIGVHFLKDSLYYEAGGEVVAIHGDWNASTLYRLPPDGY